MDIYNIDVHKRKCKKIKKTQNPQNKTLMQIQHEYAKEKGFKNWSELKKHCEKFSFHTKEIWNEWWEKTPVGENDEKREN